MNKTALIIGGTGFLGTAIVRELCTAGWAVTSLARGQKANRVADAVLIAADRSQPGQIAAAVGARRFDLVVDCAAYTRPHAEDALAAFAGKTGHYVFISTDFVYAADPATRFPIAEDAAKLKNVPYAVGKLECEALLTKAWQDQKFPATVLRPPHILGVGRELGCDPAQGRDSKILDYIRSGNGLILVGEGQFLIQPVWNREVGACIAQMAGNAASFGQIFNCAGPDCVTTRRYYEIVAERLGVPLRFASIGYEEFTKRSSDKAHFTWHRIYDTTRLSSVTGYTPRLRLEDALTETIRWMEQQKT
jgi:nucleoside-diphosphate-sugar epimerase